MAEFVGRYEHSLDTKGRVILPARFRAPFEERGGYLTKHREGCLALWTPGEFERQTAITHASAAKGRTHRNRERQWASSSQPVDIDRQGRMAVPQFLRDFARLVDDVLVVGVIDRIELWQPAAWDEQVGPEEAWLLAGGDDDLSEDED